MKLIYITTFLLLINIVFAADCTLFEDNFDEPSTSKLKWTNTQGSWSFEDQIYTSKESDLTEIISMPLTEPLSDFILQFDFLSQDKYLGVDLRSSPQTYPLLSLFLASGKIYISAFPETIYPPLFITGPVTYELSSTEWYTIKIKAEGNTIQSKVWKKNQESEPSEWKITSTISNTLLPYLDSGKIILKGENIKFDNFKITTLDCGPQVTPTSCQEIKFPKDDIIEQEGNCISIYSKAGFYRFIYTYDQDNNLKIIEPDNCNSYTCKDQYIFDKSNYKKLLVYESTDWVEKDV